jgi:hypothetical protein
MEIDLSQYIDKDVKVTCQDGTIHRGQFSYHSALCNDFVFRTVEAIPNAYIFRKNGEHWFNYSNNILKIELVDPEPKLTLDSKTLHTIASTLTPDAIKYIESHDDYAGVMVDILAEFVEKNLGNSTGELPFMIFDRMYLAKGRD